MTTPPNSSDTSTSHHICPWWMGYLLAIPLRRLIENPNRILGPLVHPGMLVIDLGSAMGFLSVPLARLVGPEGKVVCLDVQQRMLSTLMRRARRRGLHNIIDPRLCSQDGLGIEDLNGSAGLVVAFHVLHETAHPRNVISECVEALSPGGRFLIAEPSGHVSAPEFEKTCNIVRENGLVESNAPNLRKSLSKVFKKPN